MTPLAAPKFSLTIVLGLSLTAALIALWLCLPARLSAQLRGPRLCACACAYAPRPPVISALEPYHYRIERDRFGRLVEAENAAMPYGSLYRLVPATHDDGLPRGVRIYAIRPYSLLARLGLQNGDLVERVNGLPLTSPDRARAAYTQLRAARLLRVDVERHGLPVQLIYELVDRE